jgi:hypothetical protein
MSIEEGSARDWQRRILPLNQLRWLLLLWKIVAGGHHVAGKGTASKMTR